MKSRLLVITLFGALGALVLAGSSWSAQHSGQDYNRNVSQNTLPRATGQTVQDVYRGDLAISPESPMRGEIARLMKELRDAEDATAKSELTKQLETVIAKYFDEDLEARAAELTRLEERLNKLRSQLDKRRKAKAEIVQLQIKVLVNEAEGLGFSGASFFDPGALRYPVSGDWISSPFAKPVGSPSPKRAR
jgi:hypothetical protein